MQKENIILLDNQKYYDLPNGKQMRCITDLLGGFNSGSATKYVGRAGKKDKAKEKEDLTKVLTFLTFIQEDKYLTSPFIDKLAGIKTLLKKRNTPKVESDTIIKNIVFDFTSNIDSLASGLNSENRKQTIYWIYNFLVNTEESVQREALQRAEMYIKKAILELEELEK